MTDKEKIRNFLVSIADVDGCNSQVVKIIEKKIIPYIDSLQEEPVFHVGDTIRHKEENDSFKILAIEDDCYKLENNIVVSIAAQDSWELVEEPVSEEMEKAIDTYLATYWGGEKEKQDWPFLKKMAIHFANWQKWKDQETIELAEDHAMLAGMVKGKKDVVGKVRSILNKVAYRNNGLDVNGDYCEQPYVELDNEFRKLLKEDKL